MKHSGFEELNDGEDIICDVGKSSKGLSVQKIHSINTDPTELEIAKCTVVRLFRDHEYGFVQLDNSDRSAFFHFSTLSTASIAEMSEGLRLKAEFKSNQDGISLQIRKIIKIYDPANT